MTNKNIFNALRNIDEKLILDASPSENKPSSKKKILFKVLTTVAAVILVISLSIGGVMMMRRDGADEMPDDENGNKQPITERPNSDGAMMGSLLNFNNIQSFENYIYSDKNDPESYKYFDPKFYVDFSPIIPDNECEHINNTVFSDGTYRSYGISLNLTCLYGEDAQYMYDSYKSTHTSDNPDYKIYDSLNDAPKDSRFFIYNWDGNHILICPFKVEDTEYARITFIIDEYAFQIEATLPVIAPAQEEFISAFLPSLGATDDSINSMLNRIKNLPKGDEIKIAQENDTVTSNDSGSTTNQPVSEPSYEEETGDETYEEEEYLYPEDYDFPVIPGISPDWKPNANGKYPLKEAYTEYEISLILAGEIPLDLPEEGIKFGPETFPIIDETEE